MRRFKKIALLCLLIFSSVFFSTPSAAAASSEDDFVFDSATGTITGYVGAGGDVDIPSQIGGVNVVEIGDRAFRNCETITSVIIPVGVTNIAYEAFIGCDALTSVIIPEGVISIGSEAFRACGSLTSIDLPDSLRILGYQTFAFGGLTEMYLPEGMTELKPSFQHAEFLDKFVISSTIDTIQDHALSFTAISIIYIPETVTTIGDDILSSCDELYAVICREGSVADATISSRKLYLEENDFIFDASTGTITGYTGSNTNVFIPAEIGGTTVTSISSNAFEGIVSFEYVGIADTITNIGDEAFKGCPNLKSVFISESVASIGTHVFYGCDNLDEIRVNIRNSEYQSEDGILFNADKTVLIKCPPKNAITDYTIPSSVNEVVDYAFYSCDFMTSIRIPSSVTSLGQYSFYGCDELLSANLSSNLSEIPDYAFADCVKLGSPVNGSISIPASVTRIGVAAFKNTDAVSYYVPLGLERIEAEAFMNCDRAEVIRFSEDTVFIGDRAFYDCDNLMAVVISSKTLSIGSETFDNCAILSANYGLVGYRGYDVEAYASANTIAFTPIFNGFDTTTGEIDKYLGRNKHLVIPSAINVGGTYYDVIALGEQGFCLSNHDLLSIEIEEGLTTIKLRAIQNCSNLERIDLPNSITNIAEYALFDLGSLTRITIPAGITGGIHENAFHYSTNTGINIYGYSGTYAQQYAIDNSMPFVSLGYVTGVSVINQPNKMSYLSSESLDLSGLTVRLTYSDATTVDVDFEDFSVYGITTSPVHGNALDISHNNTPITITCNSESAVTNDLTVVIDGDAENPNITEQPDDVTCNVGDNEAVSVTASVSDGGTLSYQWYSNTIDSNSGGSLMSGATSSSYTVPTTNAGTTYYYCIITNTNSNVTGNTIATTTSDTAVVVCEIAVTTVDFTYDEVQILVATSDTFANVFPYTYTPSNATDAEFTISSSNPAVASVDNSTGIVSGLAEGVTRITIVYNSDNSIYDTVLLEVSDGLESSGLEGEWTGKLVDGTGQNISGYHITVCSDPITVVTNGTGTYLISNVSFSEHTLIINDASYNEIGRYAVTCTQGTAPSVTVNNATRTITVVYTAYTDGLDVRFVINSSSDIVASATLSNRQAENPRTGDDSKGFIEMFIDWIIDKINVR